jgi:NADH-quinone oxidoreductase subunit B
MGENHDAFHRSALLSARCLHCNKPLNFKPFLPSLPRMAQRIDASKLPRLAGLRGDEALLAESVAITRLETAVAWARKYSIFPYPFATACCAMEFMSLSMTPYDIDRFGALLPRFTPRQADLLMVIGTVTCRQAPILKRVYDQMAEPRWVMAFGACASTGGFYDNYTTLPGIDRIVPVDVYVPGCPPRPEVVLDALMALQRRIQQQPQLLGLGLGSAKV